MRSPLSRRSFLAGSAGFAVLTACGSDENGGSGADLTTPITFPADGTPPLVDAGSPTLGVRFPDGLRGVTSGFEEGVEARAPFTANSPADSEQAGRPLGEDAPDTMDVVVQFDGQVVSEQTVTARAKGEFTPYYPVVFTPEQAGMYAVVSSYAPEAPAWLVVNPADTLVSPHLGDVLPVAPTPTTTDTMDFERICTREPEPCPFHDVTLEEALAAGPVALLLATPAFCQTDTCGPSVDLMMSIAPDFADITVVHAEVYTEAPTDGNIPLAPLPLQFEMQWEPALWVTDASGLVVAERNWAMSSDDIRSAMAAV
ncbi:MAG: hypothetical protein OEW42_08805 [Acidimicrobiia bacterium]|nr:hypothetical protein [Acidimicrobiia bacterium]MDH5237660.1 hypothetical protein [Acidimicrobiia bacterium]